MDRRSLHEALFDLLLPAPLAPLLDMDAISRVVPAADSAGGENPTLPAASIQQLGANISGLGEHFKHSLCT